jgi:DNA-directed RNA polymerase II subunit RPB9
LEDAALLMRFCPHDSSMLYPQEEKRTRTLMYACRRCRYTEESTQPLIYRNVLRKEVGNMLSNVPSAVSDDPTLARSQNVNCASCGLHEAVFFQSDTSDARNDTLAVIFVCCNCDHKWIVWFMMRSIRGGKFCTDSRHQHINHLQLSTKKQIAIEIDQNKYICSLKLEYVFTNSKS